MKQFYWAFWNSLVGIDYFVINKNTDIRKISILVLSFE